METTALDIAMLLVRLALAATLFAHGAQKAFGWFNGPGIAGATAIFTKLGQSPAKPMVILAATTEMVSAILLALGLLTPLGAAMGAGAMLVAAVAQSKLSGNFANAKGGGEYPAVLAILAVSVAAHPGTLSVDHALGMPWTDVDALGGIVIVVATTVVAILAAAGPLIKGRK